MTRRVLITTVVLMTAPSLGCDDDIGRDSDPGSILAAVCMRVKKPPRARCERVVKQAALDVVRARPGDAKPDWMGYSIDCQKALEQVARFAPRSPEQEQLKGACCTIPDEQMLKAISALCPKP